MRQHQDVGQSGVIHSVCVFMKALRVFEYIEPLDAFRVTSEFQAISTDLGLTEWNPVVWIGRLFTMDNDVGEHWLDNWDERDVAEKRAEELGIRCNSWELMIVVPERFADGRDGPCHSPEIRKRFWTDVLKSFEISFDLIFDVARSVNERERTRPPGDSEFRPDLEERIAKWMERYH